MVWIWLAVVAVCILLESATLEMVGIWFIVGGIVAMILAGVGASTELQIIVFAVLSLALLLSLRKIALKYLLKTDEKTNADRIIGKTVKLISDIKEDQFGSIKINGILWSVVSENGKNIKAEERVTIVGIRGNKYIVKKEENK